MSLLLCSSKLPTLQRILTQCYPESLKVCGALHNIINGNPFKLQVLVDQWPNITSVVCRPRLEDMMDPTDQYTNTYFLFSKDQQSLSEMLQDPQTINWSHQFQIQGCQSDLGEVLHEASAKHKNSITTTNYLLYMKESIQSHEETDQLSKLRQNKLQISSLSFNEASVVNANWKYGGNKHSLHYVQRCIQNVPTVCAREKDGGLPVSWTLCDPTSAFGMGYTLPAYRNRGIIFPIIVAMATINYKRGTPIFCEISPENKISHKALLRTGFKQQSISCMWEFSPFKAKQRGLLAA
ncbi:glycine N-acyltransferase-like [Bombina bombina]|uniref:glycine N-acyltransferase-like n=1 Tax=Bombina bombina TaxID=8345 RepID=UPI00235AC885|nr:glycine N-acyltransferase-like [Bombina bombina]